MERKIKPCLWIVGDAQEVADYYSGIFKDVRVTGGQTLPDGSAIVREIEIHGQPFQLLQGGPADWSFNESVSFAVSCEDQAEADRLWYALTANGGEESQCGWLKDKYGLSWQIVPEEFKDMLNGGDPVKVQRMIDEMMTQQRLDLAKLRAAYDGEPARA
jgi:predicted 3-demethylubiquinone-9 3-methyltransferase (glyoxalase superfamily)